MNMAHQSSVMQLTVLSRNLKSLRSVSKNFGTSLTFQARDQAKACREQLLIGVNPLETWNAIKMTAVIERAKIMTFDQFARAYIDAHKGGWKHAKHIAQWEASLGNYASPIIGACRCPLLIRRWS